MEHHEGDHPTPAEAVPEAGGEVAAVEIDGSAGPAATPGTPAPDAQAGGHTPVIEQITVTTEGLARKAAPTVRDVGARAALVAAEVAEASGPWLQRAAAATADLSLRLAERARAFAAELERDAEGAAGAVRGEEAAAPPAAAPSPPGADAPAAGGSDADALDAGASGADAPATGMSDANASDDPASGEAVQGG
jgi:hypothetical protein